MSAGPDVRTDEVAARVLLSRLAEPGDVGLAAQLRRHGVLGVVDRILSRAAGPRACRVPGAADGGSYGRAARAAGRRAPRAGRRLAGRPGEPGVAHPARRPRGSRPGSLWVRGGADLRLAALRSVSVVGARSSTRYGEQVAAELAAGLAERGWTVVSGGAFGIDAAAHRGALAVGGVSVAVLAGGVDVSYPRGHDQLFCRLPRTACWSRRCHLAPRRSGSRFLVRNRLIAALTRGTLVVEAALRSGSLVDGARGQRPRSDGDGDPGAGDERHVGGCAPRSLRDGALLVSSAEEVVEAVGEIGADLAPRASGPVEPRDGLDPLARRVLDALPPRRAADPAGSARAAGVDPATTIATLGLLELAGFVRRDPAGWRLAPRGR